MCIFYRHDYFEDSDFVINQNVIIYLSHKSFRSLQIAANSQDQLESERKRRISQKIGCRRDIVNILEYFGKDFLVDDNWRRSCTLWCSVDDKITYVLQTCTTFCFFFLNTT